jgi:acyl carrier protein
MSPADALRALGRAIVSKEARLMIAALDWTRFLAGYGGSPPAFFADVAPPPRTAAAGGDGTDPRARRSALAAFVTREARRVLHAGEGEVLAPDAPLNEAGLDSLMALELRRALAQGLNLDLPATLLFNFPTIDALTAHLADLIGLNDAPAAPAPQPPSAPETIVENVMKMTEAEMAAVIAREFASSMTGPGHG